MKTFLAVLAAILVAYTAIHWKDGRDSRLQQSLRLSRNAHAMDEQAMNEMEAKLPNTGPIRSREQLPIAQYIRARAIAHLNEVSTNPFALSEEPVEARRLISIADKVIAEFARTAANPSKVAFTEDPTPKDTPPAVPAQKQWRAAGSALDRPAK